MIGVGCYHSLQMAQGTLNKKLHIMHSVRKKPDSAAELGGTGKSKEVSCFTGYRLYKPKKNPTLFTFSVEKTQIYP